MTIADELGPAHDILVHVLIACAQKPPLNAHAGISSEARSKFGFGSSSTSPNCVYLSSELEGYGVWPDCTGLPEPSLLANMISLFV